MEIEKQLEITKKTSSEFENEIKERTRININLLNDKNSKMYFNLHYNVILHY